MTDFLKQPVLDALERVGRPLKSKELARELDVPSSRYRAFREFLKGLVASGELYRVKHGRYAPPEKINLVRGSLSVIKSGAAFLVRDGAGDDVFIPADGRITAFHRDRVVVRIERTRRGKLEGRVVRVLERAREEFVGTLNKTKHFAFVKADDPRFNRDILIPPDELGDAEDGAKVTAKIIDWGSLTSAPIGSVTQVLGQVGDPGLDILMIIKNNGLPESFPEEIEEAAAKIPDKIPKKEIDSRLDLRDVEVVTIDPPTARDFDDALSLTKDKDGNYEIGVHIADVSHYVRHDDIIDREAWNRATSVYLVDRVLPMLPEKLSNNLCSLNPDVDRLAMSAMVTMTPRGRILGYRIEDTIIRSNRRFAYEEVQAYFDGEEGALEHVGEQRPLIDALRKMAGVLNQKRRLRGALDFDLPSSRVLLDEKGFPTEIKKVVRTESNRLVEEFMLLANEIVAKHLKGLKKPAPYRVHEEPEPQKLDDLQEVISRFGLVIRTGKDDRIDPKELQRLLKESEGKPESDIVHMLVLRSMMRARYDIFPLGHFGLALKDYTHFTSPIRRYPDLLVHRVLRFHSKRQKSPFKEEGRFREWLDEACLRSSDRERLAESAERDSIELKKVQFMERYIGDVFWGVISGVESFGFFVELEDYHVSGLVHVNNLGDDYYEYREKELTLIGSSSGRKFTLGDRLRVQVLAVKKELRQIDFILEGQSMDLDEGVSPDQRRRKARGVYEGKTKSSPRRGKKRAEVAKGSERDGKAGGRKKSSRTRRSPGKKRRR